MIKKIVENLHKILSKNIHTYTQTNNSIIVYSLDKTCVAFQRQRKKNIELKIKSFNFFFFFLFFGHIKGIFNASLIPSLQLITPGKLPADKLCCFVYCVINTHSFTYLPHLCITFLGTESKYGT